IQAFITPFASLNTEENSTVRENLDKKTPLSRTRRTFPPLNRLFPVGPTRAIPPPVMRYPIIHQQDATDCGPAVLAMIAAHYKKRLSIARIRESAGTDRRGTSLMGLSSAAEQVGFQARAVRASQEGLSQLFLPAVAHWREGNRNHFVVIYKVTPKRIVVGDPAGGLRKLTPEEFQKNWTGVLLLLKPTPRLRDAVNSKSAFSQMFLLLLPHYRLFLDALLAAV